MKWGYTPGYTQTPLEPVDWFKEIDFARAHFDFIELMLPPYFSLFRAQRKSLQERLQNSTLFGHLPLEIDFEDRKDESREMALHAVEIFGDLRAKKITMHATADFDAITEISSLCKKYGIELCIENRLTPPFNTASFFAKMVERFPRLKMTLDIGHAKLASKTELRKFTMFFGKRISHIHLHDARDKVDHLAFSSASRVISVRNALRKIGYNNSITLEIFDVYENKEVRSYPPEQRKKLVLQQLQLIKNCFARATGE